MALVFHADPEELGMPGGWGAMAPPIFGPDKIKIFFHIWPSLNTTATGPPNIKIFRGACHELFMYIVSNEANILTANVITQYP